MELLTFEEEERELHLSKKKRMSSVKNDLLRLPEEIVLNILSRLPVESVLHCRLLCKTWRNLLPPRHDNNTYFADMHLRRLLQNKKSEETDDTKLSFVFMGSRYEDFYYVEYDENDVQSYNKHKRIKLPIPAYAQSLVGSCNGLICFAARFGSYAHDPIYICNPITRECVHLPRFIKNKKQEYSSITHGFGYHPSTNEYKVVRVMNYNSDLREMNDNSDRDTSTGQVQVYTLGSGMGWRNKGEISHRMQLAISPHGTRLSPHGILLNGALHWLSSKGNIVAFDLADEEFRCLPTIPGSSPIWFYTGNLWRVGGRLCVVHTMTNINAGIWLLKNKNDEKHGTSSNDPSWRWSREFTIEFDKRDTCHQPFSITKRGEILLFYEGKYIICCDPKPNVKSKKFGDIGDAKIDRYTSAISHFNSFVSLKALGEDAKILKTII